jgi:hypothetical protein
MVPKVVVGSRGAWDREVQKRAATTTKALRVREIRLLNRWVRGV